MTIDETAQPPVESREESISFWRKAFSLPALIVVLLGFVAFWTASQRYQDPDTWWHLKVGERIWQTGELPRVDEYSYTTDAHAWIPHEWLPEVTIYAAYLLGGPQGLMLWLCVTGTVLLGSLYLFCVAYSGNAKVALIGGLIGWFFGTISLSVRPLLFGHIFLILMLALVHLGRTRSARWLWGLPVLFAIWVNCHGSFAFGGAVLAVILGAAHLDFRLGLIESVRWPPEKLRVFRYAFLACGAALFLNPVGWQLPAYPLNLLFEQGDNLASIDEWQPLNFQESRGMGVFVVSIVLTIAALALQKKVWLEELVMVLLGSYLAVKHSRMVFVFGILTAPVVCRLLADSWRKYSPRQDFPKFNALLMAIAVALIWWKFPDEANLKKQVDGFFPTEALSYIQEHHVEGRMLNEYAWGGYLIWFAPERKVFIDGRTDIFDWTGVLADYMRWYTLREDPGKLLDKYKIDYCVLFGDSPITVAVGLLPNWEKAYSDDLAVVFTRKHDSPKIESPTDGGAAQQ